MQDDVTRNPETMEDLRKRIAALSPAKRALLELRLQKQGLASPAIQTIPRRTIQEAIPLSFAQQRLWFLDQFEPNSPLYNIIKAIRIQGPLRREALQHTLNMIIKRHEVLRTIFIARDGTPHQIIRDPQPAPLQVIDLRPWPAATREAEAHRLLQQEAHRPFDLTQDLMLRATLLHLKQEEYLLLLVMHHIASDGWSMSVLFREFSILYAAFASGQPSPLPELPLQYADFAIWQREWLQGKVLDEQLAYWKKQLADAPPLLELPTDHPRPSVQQFRGAHHPFQISSSLTDALKGMSQQEGVTLFMTLLAAFQTLLYRYSGQEDILIGSPIAGRTRAELEGLIGFFVNTLVLRTRFAETLTFRELLSQVREVCLGAYAHQELPFEKLVEELQPARSLSHTPLFQVLFVLQNTPRSTLALPGVTVSPLDVEGDTTKFDLTLSLTEERDGLKGWMKYNTALFGRTTIQRMVGHFQTLLAGIVANPDQPIGLLPLLTPPERHQLLVEWNNTQTDYSTEWCIHELFEAQVERTPDAIAVVFEDTYLTYRELNARANQLAHHLREVGVGPEVLVGIYMERSLEMVVGILGILKAGGAYMPLDPIYPQERLAFMLTDAQVQIVLTQEELLASLPMLENSLVLCLTRDWEEITQKSSENLSTEITTDNLAYVMYTSGSTGKPKGVMISHRGICNYLLWIQRAYPLTEKDRVLQRASFGFDVSVREIFWPLIAGAQLVMIRAGNHYDIAYLIQLIRDQHITVVRFEPSVLQVLLKEQGLETCKNLRHVICGGELLPSELQEQLFIQLDTEFHNAYGPTEASISATFWTCKRDENYLRSVPIGFPIANTQIYLLDAHLQPVPVGIPGELYISGEGLARGYFNRPELTAEKFIPNPFCNEPGSRLYKTGDLARYRPDGSIEFLGRIDDQVKIRGFRIELGEIEVVLSQHVAVRDAVVLLREDLPGDKRLVAYIVPHPPEQVPSLHDLQSFLKQKLPEYMLPSAYVFLEVFPLTPSGKINRRALPAPERTRPALDTGFVAPRTSMEALIAEIWQEVLGVDRVGVYDNFFDLGGHSLLSMQVVARLEKQVGIRINPREMIFQNLGQLAAICEGQLSLLPKSNPKPSFTQTIWDTLKRYSLSMKRHF